MTGSDNECKNQRPKRPLEFPEACEKKKSNPILEKVKNDPRIPEETDDDLVGDLVLRK